MRILNSTRLDEFQIKLIKEEINATIRKMEADLRQLNEYRDKSKSEDKPDIHTSRHNLEMLERHFNSLTEDWYRQKEIDVAIVTQSMQHIHEAHTEGAKSRLSGDSEWNYIPVDAHSVNALRNFEEAIRNILKL